MTEPERTQWGQRLGLFILPQVGEGPVTMLPVGPRSCPRRLVCETVREPVLLVEVLRQAGRYISPLLWCACTRGFVFGGIMPRVADASGLVSDECWLPSNDLPLDERVPPQ